MNQAQQIANTLPYKGKKVLLVKEHDTNDIVNAIKKHHKLYRKDYDSIADQFWGGDVKTTAKRLFDFNKQYITYDVEHPDNQTVKSPGAIIAQKHGDCKHYASLINGVADALQRKGHNIQSRYRFVADGPDREIHHVFAVLSDGTNDYWVDPVLSRFNDQPIFYNTKEVAMGDLYSISGTGFRPRNLPIVGKTNIFKKLATAVKVNTANVKKAVKVNTANAGKEVKKVAKDVKHVALQVSMAPARNAFLALLDLNAFNLATRMGDALVKHRAAVELKWRDLGGDVNKLKSAIHNGRKHKAFYHKQPPPKKIGGVTEAINKVQAARNGYINEPMVQILVVPTLRRAYDIGPDHRGRLPQVSGIGEPVSTATLTALAAAIIAAFNQFMAPDKGANQNSTQAAQDGVANMIKNASDAIDAGNIETGTRMMDAATKGANAINTIRVNAGTNTDGTPTLAVQQFDHPQLLNAGTPTAAPVPGTPDYYRSPSDTVTDKITNIPTMWLTDIADQAKQVWEDYKTPIVFAGIGIVAYNVATKKKKRR